MLKLHKRNDFLKGSGCAGHSDPFCCCQNNSLRGLPPSFFGIHILGGMVLFMTDGIVVSVQLLSQQEVFCS